MFLVETFDVIVEFSLILRWKKVRGTHVTLCAVRYNCAAYNTSSYKTPG